MVAREQKKTAGIKDTLQRTQTPVNPNAMTSEQFSNKFGVAPDTPWFKYKEIQAFRAATSAKQATAALNQEKAKQIQTDPKRMKISDVIPNLTDEQIQDQFGEGVTRDTNFKLVLELNKMKAEQNKRGKMFPISALSPEAQAAARANNMPDYIPESTARLLSGSNPIRLPSYEESTSFATSESIVKRFEEVEEILPLVQDDVLGFGKYQYNKYGQYTDLVDTDPNVTTFLTIVQSIQNSMIYYMSGKQINEKEERRIRNELPDPNLKPVAFYARLEQSKKNFEYLKTLKNKASSTVGRRTPDFSTSESQPNATAAPEQKQKSTKFKYINGQLVPQ